MIKNLRLINLGVALWVIGVLGIRYYVSRPVSDALIEPTLWVSAVLGFFNAVMYRRPRRDTQGVHR